MTRKKERESKKESMAMPSLNVLELKKHVAVIHSSNKLSLLQRKIANALLFNAYADLQDKDEHTIHIAKLCELIGYASHDHKTIKRALVNLLSTVLEWNLVDGERLDTEGIWNASSIIADASINGAMCTYSYSNKMRKLLYRPHMYGRLDMHVQAKFQSAYGLALYENCNRFQDIGQTPWFNLTMFRQLMGVEEGRYKIFRDFKTRVLDKAVEEVNKYSTLVIYPQLRKQHRQVVSIQFLIKKTKVMSPLESHETDEGKEENVAAMLTSQFAFSSKQVKDTLSLYKEEYIKEKMDIITSSSSFKQGRVKHLARYLISALRDDYQATKSAVPSEENHVLPTHANQASSLHQDVLRQTAFKRFQDKQLIGLFNQLPAKRQSSLLKKFEKGLTGMYHHVYLRTGLQNLLVQDQLCLFLRQIKDALVEQLCPYDRWLRDYPE
jgi:plasmid replication initiation protein